MSAGLAVAIGFGIYSWLHNGGQQAPAPLYFTEEHTYAREDCKITEETVVCTEQVPNPAARDDDIYIGP